MIFLEKYADQIFPLVIFHEKYADQLFPLMIFSRNTPTSYSHLGFFSGTTRSSYSHLGFFSRTTQSRNPPTPKRLFLSTKTRPHQTVPRCSREILPQLRKRQFFPTKTLGFQPKHGAIALVSLKFLQNLIGQAYLGNKKQKNKKVSESLPPKRTNPFL